MLSLDANFGIRELGNRQDFDASQVAGKILSVSNAFRDFKSHLNRSVKKPNSPQMNRRVLQCKRVLITGAGGGIGCALATAAVQLGMRVVISDLAADRLEQTRVALLANDKDVKAITADNY